MEDIKLQDFYDKIIKGWMMGGLSTVSKECLGENFIPALCCFTFTEAVGLYLPKLDEDTENYFKNNKIGKNGGRFYRCLFSLESKERFIECDRKLRKNGVKKGIYQLRHRFAHKYLPNLVEPQHIQVEVVGSHKQNKGRLQQLKDAGLFFPIVLKEDDERIRWIIINTVKYIEELRNLVDDVYNKIFIERDNDFVIAMHSGYRELLRDD
ncbi:MAG: hypothetical protein HYW70_00320 [Candidatus Nealsonbacteria bacterium]|nr:hypothetical protein [Candidatus Nealsonbacteria bacterium]